MRTHKEVTDAIKGLQFKIKQNNAAISSGKCSIVLLDNENRRLEQRIKALQWVLTDTMDIVI